MTRKFYSKTILKRTIAVIACIPVIVMAFWTLLHQPNSATTSAASYNKPTLQSEQINIVNRAAKINLASTTTRKTQSPNPKPSKHRLATIVDAENQTYTKDGRLFVTGRDGIFEIIPSSVESVKVVQRLERQSCSFGGIVEVAGTLYANCYGKGLSYLYAAALKATPTFKRIYTLKNTVLANGLTADSRGWLYVASTFKDQILRLVPSNTNPLSIARSETWLRGSGWLTNGIKFANEAIYWTDGTHVKRAIIKANGAPDKQKTIVAAPPFFDDISVDSTEIMVADYLSGAIRRYDLNGNPTATIRSGLAGPSSVARARAPLPINSLIITERSGNQVSLVKL